MDGVYFGTTEGELHMVGRIQADPERPVLLTVLGAFPPKNQKHELVARFPDASVLVCRYPGMHSTTWRDASPLRVAAALDELIAVLFKGRRVVAYGLSTGCLATLNLRSKEVRHQVAQEPFLTTSHLAPLIEYCRAFITKEPDNRALSDFVWQLFGVTLTELADRDYRRLRSDPTLPLDLIVGAKAPLSFGGKLWPSFTLEEDRRALLDRPEARLHVGPEGSGHFVEATPAAIAMVTDCLARVLESVGSGSRQPPRPYAPR